MSKEHAYAYEAGYRDGSINYELEHCPACKNVADLQEVLEENAKLRELVRIAGTYCVNGLCGKDDGCPLYLGKPYCALPDLMRELGIEVGE